MCVPLSRELAVLTSIIMSASTATRKRKSESYAVFSLRATIMQRALDLASAVATYLDAAGPAAMQADSPLGRSTPRACLAWRLCDSRRTVMNNVGNAQQ